MTTLTCTNDRYCPTADTFETVEEFLTMCRAAFGAAEVPTLTHQPMNGHYVDERGEVVLVEDDGE